MYPSAQRNAWYGAFIRCADPFGRGHARPGEVFRRLPHRKRDTGFDERRIDSLTAAGAIAMVQRGENSGEREESRAQIGERQPRFHRRAIRFAGHRHDARDALRDQIEPALLAVRTGTGRTPKSTRRSARG